MRITLEQVIEAYKETGFKPINRSYITFDKGKICACPLSAIYFKIYPHLIVDIADFVHGCVIKLAMQNLYYNPSYVAGFIDAVDNVVQRGVSISYNTGYSDGLAVHSHFFSCSNG